MEGGLLWCVGGKFYSLKDRWDALGVDNHNEGGGAWSRLSTSSITFTHLGQEKFGIESTTKDGSPDITLVMDKG